MEIIIYTIWMAFATLIFISTSIMLTTKNFLLIISSILFMFLFKKTSNILTKISNKIMYLIFFAAEAIIFLTLLNNLESSTATINIILSMVTMFLIFALVKKNTNHCVTLYALLVYLGIFYAILYQNIKFPLVMFISIMPLIDYLISKINNSKTNRFLILLSICTIIVVSIISTSLYIKKDLITLNIQSINIILIIITYYFYIKFLVKLLYGHYRKILINKSFFKKYIKLNNLKQVTAVIPNYNYAHYMHERILSIVTQTYPVYELIILDDCSTDNSIEVISKEMEWLKKEYPNIIVKFIPNKVNSGNVFKQWQKAFETSTGEYLWICEADDLCSKYFLNSVMRGFEDNNVVLSYAESKAIDENGHVFKKNLRDWIDIFKTGHWNNDYIENGNHELKYFLSTNNTIANVSGVVFKKDAKIDFIKYLNEAQNFTLAGDWYFYSKVILNKKISYVFDSLNYHRIHSSSVTSTTDNFVHYKEILAIQNSISNDVKIPFDMQNRISQRNAALRRNFCISDDEIYYDKMDIKQLIKENNINDDILLSIIIPVYNVEKYLTKCLKSVFKNLPIKTEVIVINDGSPDNSEQIIQEFSKKHKEIVYIKKENGGLSSVKNLGLKQAKGKYIIFLDSDDYISSNMYSTMLKKIIDKHADIVYCDVLMTYEDNSVKYITMKNCSHDDALMQILDGNLMAASWNKMVKKELYDNLSFPEGLNNEDVAVSPQLFLRANRIEYIQSPFYKYVQRSGSIQNSGFNEKRFVIFKTASICFESIKNYTYIEQEKVIGAIITHQILAILIYLIIPISDKSQRIKYINQFCKEFNKLDIDVSNNQYVYEYLAQHKMTSLLENIEKCDISAIERMIKHAKN